MMLAETRPFSIDGERATSRLNKKISESKEGEE